MDGHGFEILARYGIDGRALIVGGVGGLLVGAMAAGAGAGAAVTLASALLGLAMTLITIADWRTQFIPDLLTYPIAALGLATAFMAEPDAAWVSLADRCAAALLAAGLLLAVRALYRRARDIEGLGLGDVKLAGAAGVWLGMGGIGPALLLACAGALAGAWAISAREGTPLNARMALPFGAFLAPSLVAVWLFHLWSAWPPGNTG